MRGLLSAIILAGALALGAASEVRAAPAVGSAILDAASTVQLAEQVHCRWDGAYHCHSWGCHYGCGVRRRYIVPRYHVVPRYRVYPRYRAYRYYHRRW